MAFILNKSVYCLYLFVTIHNSKYVPLSKTSLRVCGHCNDDRS